MASKRRATSRPPLTRETEGHWTIDRHIPAALIFTIVVQTIGVIMWATKLADRVENLEKTAHQSTAIVAPMNDRVTRLETRLEGIKDDLTEIKVLLRPREKRADLDYPSAGR